MPSDPKLDEADEPQLVRLSAWVLAALLAEIVLLSLLGWAVS